MRPTTIVPPLAGAAVSAGPAATRQGMNLVARLRARDAAPKPGMDDATLKAKVESTLFRAPGAAKDKVSVTVVDGVVELRGEVKRPQDIHALEAGARAIPEVRDVQSLLHLHRTPARPQATPRRPKTAAASKPRTGRQRTTGETQRAVKPAAAGPKAEKTPLEKAAAREGRTAAPMGSTD
jgi:hypothetical protein